MPPEKFEYIIVGAGLAGCYAVEGIRAHDTKGAILLIGDEKHLPYDRPPLTKKLWFGKKTVDEIFVHPPGYYADNNVDIALNTRIVTLDAAAKLITSQDDKTWQYGKLLLATGGTPRLLDINGGSLDKIYYYRYLDDFLKLKSEVHSGTKALVIGGGFIGSEIAAALNVNQVDVTMLLRGPYLLDLIFPNELGSAVQNDFIRRGVRIFTADTPVSIAKRNSHFVTRTKNGMQVDSDVVIAGIGIEPDVRLAKSAALAVTNGIVVDEFLQTSAPDVYAAGDNASFPYHALARRMRIEHWDNAVNQGKTAGMNMAGAHTPYTYMPYFFSDLFDFGFEAVGLVNSRMETLADWQKANAAGVVYYLEDGRVRGVMCCNLWNKIDAARRLITAARRLAPAQLHGAVA